MCIFKEEETACRILQETVEARAERRKRFAWFCGIWTDEDYREFIEVTKDLGYPDNRSGVPGSP
jgi:hypothetical protein